MVATAKDSCLGALLDREDVPKEALRRLALRLPGAACIRDGSTGWFTITASPSDRILVRAPEDPFDALRASTASFSGSQGTGSGDPGWIGLLTYEAGRAIEHLPERLQEPEMPPRLYLARYESALWWHPKYGGRLCKESTHWRGLVDALFDPLCCEEERRLIGRPLGEPRLDMTSEEYLRAYSTILEAIRRGDVYQVNLTTQVRGEWLGSPLAFHESLVGHSPPPWAGYLELEDVVISSASPELLLAYDARSRRVVSAPIKGTAPRSESPSEDARSRERLANSSKDRAEHVMIVDLVRNDLGKVCEPGTIRASPLMCPLKLPGIHHLVTEVHGQLRADRSLDDLLRAIYPGGSITGAPKVSAMTYIEELESSTRGVYCGALGRISCSGDLVLALPIRTATLTSKGDKETWKVSYGAGGGLVADSQSDEEYSELLLKARRVMEVLGDE